MKKSERDDQFCAAIRLCQARSIVKGFGTYHRFYCLYTTLDRVRTMIKDRWLWLTRVDSDLFDDTIEHRKYGDSIEQKKLFIKCFSFGGEENAAMWGLYCPPTYQALRVVIPGTAMSHWSGSRCAPIGKNNKPRGRCEVFDPYVSDIVYAAVRRDDSEPQRSNYLYWNGVYTEKRIADIEISKERKRMTGFVKDEEWKFENETRLFVKTKRFISGEHIAISVPDEIIQNMSFTLSPWLNDDEESFVRTTLSMWLREQDRDISADKDSIFRKSALRNGLVRWKQQRGL